MRIAHLGNEGLPAKSGTDDCTCVSRPDAEFLEARYHHAVRYIPHGADDSNEFDLWRAADRLTECGLQPGHFLMFAAARMDLIKDCHIHPGQDCQAVRATIRGLRPEGSVRGLGWPRNASVNEDYIAEKRGLYG